MKNKDTCNAFNNKVFLKKQEKSILAGKSQGRRKEMYLIWCQLYSRHFLICYLLSSVWELLFIPPAYSLD